MKNNLKASHSVSIDVALLSNLKGIHFAKTSIEMKIFHNLYPTTIRLSANVSKNDITFSKSEDT